MSQEIEAINTTALENNEQNQTVNNTSDTQKKASQGPVDPLMLAYLFILESVQLTRDTVAVNAKELQVNAADQNNMINQEAKLNFNTLQLYKTIHENHVTAGANGKVTAGTTERIKVKLSATGLAAFNAGNEEISAVRGVLSDRMGSLQQDAQIKSAQVNTDQDMDQQDISEGTSLMTLLTQVTQQVSRI